MKITINKLIEFEKSNTIKKKYRIIRPYKFKENQKYGFYQTFKSKVKKFYNDKLNIEHIFDGIAKLNAEKPDNRSKETNKRISLLAFERFLKFKFPVEFNNVTILTPLYKNFVYHGLDINVTPDVIFKIEIEENQFVLGCVKLHNTKASVFDNKEQELVSTLLYEYLSFLYGDQYLVSSELCYSFDIYGSGYVSTNRKDIQSNNDKIIKIINEYSIYWNEIA